MGPVAIIYWSYVCGCLAWFPALKTYHHIARRRKEYTGGTKKIRKASRTVKWIKQNQSRDKALARFYALNMASDKNGEERAQLMSKSSSRSRYKKHLYKTFFQCLKRLIQRQDLLPERTPKWKTAAHGSNKS